MVINDYIIKFKKLCISNMSSKTKFNKYLSSVKIGELLNKSINQKNIDEYTTKILDTLKETTNVATKYSYYHYSKCILEYIVKDFPNIEYNIGIVFANKLEKQLYLLKKLQNKSYNLEHLSNIDELELDDLLCVYSERSIKDDIKEIFLEGILINGINIKVPFTNKNYVDNVHPIFLFLNSDELFYLLKVLSENKSNYVNGIIDKICYQLSDNARKFLENHIRDDKIQPINLLGTNADFLAISEQIENNRIKIEHAYKAKNIISVRTKDFIEEGFVVEFSWEKYFYLNTKKINFSDVLEANIINY